MHRPYLLLTACALTGAVFLHAQSPGDFEKSVVPVLSAHCYACHNEKLKSGGLNLQAFRDSASAEASPDVWKQVAGKLSAHLMPPPPLPGLSAAELAAVTAWIHKVPGANSSASTGPGRVTARRLNRMEYDNTIRDLLGVTIHPADEFPLDDSGYGFDDIGDVLSLSPMLMEKLSTSARRVARAAVFGENYGNEPGLIVKILPKRIQDDSFANGDVFPFSLRGSLIGTFHAPVEADYEFQMQIANRRTPDHNPAGPPENDKPMPKQSTEANAPEPPPPGPPARAHARGPLTQEQIKAFEAKACEAVPPVQYLFTVDGETALSKDFRGNNACDYARPPSAVRVHLTAGDHQLRGYFPALNDIDPIRNMGENGRRRLDVEYLDIFGPYNPSHAHPASFRKIFICGADGNYTPECQRRIIENLARRAYRRPPAAGEVDTLMKLVALVENHGDSFETGVQTALQAILMSPSFLYRFEHEPPPGQAVYHLDDYELASRLSYFLWSSMPDDQLMRLADQKRLHDPAVLDAQVRRMMQDAKADNLVDNFAAQWLNLRALDHKKPDPEKFPAVDDELLADMKTETLLFMREIMRQDHSVLDVIDAPFTYVNGPLARFYGIPGITGLNFQRVALDGAERGGVLTQASILISTSYATRTSPVLRGKWVLGTLLGQEPPPPPPGIPAFPEAKVGLNLTLRQILAEHRNSPTCSVCHNQMDPIGLSLENYDAAGGWRTRDGHAPIDNSGTLPDGTSIAGAGGLKKVLRARSDLFARNVVKQMLTFAIGRGMEASDGPAVDRIAQQAAAQNYRFSAVVMAIVHSSPFQMREGETMVAVNK